MFKSWVKDLQEAFVNATTPSGVPANQRLVGTDAHRKYVEQWYLVILMEFNL